METSHSNNPPTTVRGIKQRMIRDSLLEWRNTTELLIRILKVKDDKLRDGVVLQTEQLLNKREELKASIHAPFTEDEQVVGQALLELEKELDALLKLSLKNIRNDIGDQQKKKVSVHAYMDPYSQVFRDGTFYDKKK